jgi:hypothetical protein
MPLWGIGGVFFYLYKIRVKIGVKNPTTLPENISSLVSALVKSHKKPLII